MDMTRNHHELHAREFKLNGYTIIRHDALVQQASELRRLFLSQFHSRFGDQTARNRSLIKRFGASLEVASFSIHPAIRDCASIAGIKEPVFCGPVVTHYTSSDLTGNAYGLPYHQGWPSMSSSVNSVVVWVSLRDANEGTHSVIVAPGRHKEGLLPGQQSDSGYVLSQDRFEGEVVLEIKAGELLVMSAFLPHKTHVHPTNSEWKLSLSRRLDDLACPSWARRDYRNAYQTRVDRSLYLLD